MKCKDLDIAGKNILLNDDTRSYTDREVRELVLEIQNAALYAHSHKFTRKELQSEIEIIKESYNLFPYGLSA